MGKKYKYNYGIINFEIEPKGNLVYSYDNGFDRILECYIDKSDYYNIQFIIYYKNSCNLCDYISSYSEYGTTSTYIISWFKKYGFNGNEIIKNLDPYIKEELELNYKLNK